MSVWVMPSVIDVYENFLKRSQAVAGGRRRWAPPMPQSTFVISYTIRLSIHFLSNQLPCMKISV